MIRISLLSAAAALALGSAAYAQVTLERKEAPVGASCKAVLRVPHGCESGEPAPGLKLLPKG
jgi:periplasmic copper chaperone A